MKLYTIFYADNAYDTMTVSTNTIWNYATPRSSYDAYIDRLVALYGKTIPWLSENNRYELNHRHYSRWRSSFLAERQYHSNRPKTVIAISSTSVNQLFDACEKWVTYLGIYSIDQSILFGRYWRDITNLIGEEI